MNLTYLLPGLLAEQPAPEGSSHDAVTPLEGAGDEVRRYMDGWMPYLPTSLAQSQSGAGMVGSACSLRVMFSWAVAACRPCPQLIQLRWWRPRGQQQPPWLTTTTSRLRGRRGRPRTPRSLRLLPATRRHQRCRRARRRGAEGHHRRNLLHSPGPCRQRRRGRPSPSPRQLVARCRSPWQRRGPGGYRTRRRRQCSSPHRSRQRKAAAGQQLWTRQAAAASQESWPRPHHHRPHPRRPGVCLHLWSLRRLQVAACLARWCRAPRRVRWRRCVGCRVTRAAGAAPGRAAPGLPY